MPDPAPTTAPAVPSVSTAPTPGVIPAVADLAAKLAADYKPQDKLTSLQSDREEWQQLLDAADSAIDTGGAPAAQPAASQNLNSDVPNPAEVAPAAAAQPPAQPAAAPTPPEPAKPKGRTLDDPPEGAAAPAPIRSLSHRERLLEKQTREPLEQQLAAIRKELDESRGQHKSFQENLQQLYREGRVEEASRLAFGAGLSDLQRADLIRRGALPQQKPENPETAELRTRIERFEQAQANEAKQRAELQRKQETQRAREAAIRDVTAEMEASGYEDVARLSKTPGFTKLVLESIEANPALDNEHHYRQAKTKVSGIADQLIGALYPHLVPYLKGGVPPVSQQTGVSPAQAGVTPAAPPVAQTGVTPVQPSAPAAPTALPQSNSADAGQRKYASDDEEWNALKAQMGLT